MASKQTITIILWVLIAVFMVGIVLWNVPRNSTNTGTTNHYRTGPNRVLVTVNGEPIDADTFDQAFYDSLGKENQSSDLNETLKQRSAVFSEMLQDMVANQVLRGFGIRNVNRPARQMAQEISDRLLKQIHTMLQAQVEQQMAAAKTETDKKAVPSAQALFNEQVQQFYTEHKVEPPKNITDASFRKFYVDVLTNPQYTESKQFMEFVRKSLIGREIIKRDLTADVSSEAYAKKLATEQVNARWIYIAADDYTTAAMQAAKTKAEKLHDQIVKDPSQFAALASKESNHLSHTEGGNLGWISGSDPRTGFPALVEYLLFTQKPKELGPVTQICLPPTNPEAVLSSKVGYGFVQVLADPQERKDLGPNFDWARMKDDYMTALKQRYEQSIGQDYLLATIAQADIKFSSKEIESYLATLHGQYTKSTALQRQALEKETDLPRPVVAALSYRVAMSSPDIKGEARIPLLEAALEYAGPMRWQLQLALGDTYQGVGRKEDAITQYQFAIKAAGPQEEYVRKEVRIRYQKLGYTEGIKEIDKWQADKQKASASSNESVPLQSPPQ